RCEAAAIINPTRRRYVEEAVREGLAASLYESTSGGAPSLSKRHRAIEAVWEVYRLRIEEIEVIADYQALRKVVPFLQIRRSLDHNWLATSAQNPHGKGVTATSTAWHNSQTGLRETCFQRERPIKALGERSRIAVAVISA